MSTTTDIPTDSSVFTCPTWCRTFGEHRLVFEAVDDQALGRTHELRTGSTPTLDRHVEAGVVISADERVTAAEGHPGYLRQIVAAPKIQLWGGHCDGLTELNAEQARQLAYLLTTAAEDLDAL